MTVWRKQNIHCRRENRIDLVWHFVVNRPDASTGHHPELPSPPKKHQEMYFCAISGEPPQEPVVSSKSGQIYERRLILKYIQENGTEPTTGDKLEETDLIALKASKIQIQGVMRMQPGELIMLLSSARSQVLCTETS